MPSLDEIGQVMFEKNMKMKKVNNDDDANDRQWTHFFLKSSRAFGSGELPISLVRKMFCFVIGFFTWLHEINVLLSQDIEQNLVQFNIF